LQQNGNFKREKNARQKLVWKKGRKKNKMKNKNRRDNEE